MQDLSVNEALFLILYHTFTHDTNVNLCSLSEAYMRVVWTFTTRRQIWTNSVKKIQEWAGI